MYKLGYFINKKMIYINVIETTNKNIYLKVEGKEIVAYAPKTSRKKTVNKFIYENIEKFVEYINDDSRVELYSIKDLFIIIGSNRYEIITLTGFKKTSLMIKGTKAYINSNSGTDNEIELIIKSFLKKQLDNYLKNNFYKMEKRMNLNGHIYKIVYKKSNWGTNMIGKKSISFSSRLSHFSINVIDYVIIHELAHTIEPNHSSSFWDIVDEYCKDVKKLKKILKNTI